MAKCCRWPQEHTSSYFLKAYDSLLKMLSFGSKTRRVELRFSHHPTFFTIDTSKAISCWDNERCQVRSYDRLALLPTPPHSECRSALQHAMCLSSRQSFLPSWRVQGLQTPGRCISCWAAFLGHGTQQVSYFLVTGISLTAGTLHVSQKCPKLQSSWSFSSILWVTCVLPKLQYASCFTSPVNMVLSLLWASVILGSVPGCHGPLRLYCDRR